MSYRKICYMMTYLPYPLCTCDFMYSNGHTTHQPRVAATPEIRKGPSIGRLKCSGKFLRPVSTSMKYVHISPIVRTHVMPNPWQFAK